MQLTIFDHKLHSLFALEQSACQRQSLSDASRVLMTVIKVHLDYSVDFPISNLLRGR